MKEIKVLSVNISEKKGTIKHPVDKIVISSEGIVNDAHAGGWHRQVSLLAKESVDRFEHKAGRPIKPGEFAENILTVGMELFKASVFDRFVCGPVELEVTQIGKECHGDSCAIFKEIGKCVMPKEGIFCRVIKTGAIQSGDILVYHPKIFRILVVTLSDRASKGEYTDRSGPRVKSLTEDYFKSNNWKCQVENKIIPDEAKQLKIILKKAKKEKTDVIFTTGGTGIGKRDITPDAVRSVLDKEIPGIMELVRIKYGMEKPNALLSRGVAGVMGESLVYTLPGSVKAVEEYTEEIFKTLSHTIFMMQELDVHK